MRPLVLLAFVGLAVASVVQIHGQNHRRSASRFRAFDDGLGNLPNVCGVELLPHWPAARGDSVFNGRRGNGGQHDQMTLLPRRSGHAQLTIGMERFLGAHGREHDGRVPLRAENGPRHVDVGDVDQTARTYLNVRIAVAIRAHGSVVVHARCQIAPMRRGNVFSRRGFEIHHAECLIRRRDNLITLLKIL